MDKFEASNGMVVLRLENGLGFQFPNHLTSTSGIGKPKVDALREFFQHERDEELGRVRVQGYPDHALYVDEDGDVVVLDERDGETSSLITRKTIADFPKHRACVVAAAYFEAHPERKPWHEAECGESWYLEPFDIVYTCVGDKGHGQGLWFTRSNVFGAVETVALDDPRITAGRRIWPESD